MKIAKLGKHIIKLGGQEITLWIGKNTLSLIAPDNAKLEVTIPFVKPYTIKHKEVGIQIKGH